MQLSTDVPEAFRQFSIGLLSIRCDPKIDVILGADWHKQCMHRAHLPASQCYVDAIFDLKSTATCIFGDSPLTSNNEMQRHGLEPKGDVAPISSIITHILRGECCNSDRAEGCMGIVTSARTKDQSAVVEYVVSRIRIMSEDRLPSDHVRVICESTGLHAGHIVRVDCILQLMQYAELYGSPLRSRCADLSALQSRTHGHIPILAYSHGIPCRNVSEDTLRSALYAHIIGGHCTEHRPISGRVEGLIPYSGCTAVCLRFGVVPGSNTTCSENEIKSYTRSKILTQCGEEFGVQAMRKVVALLGIAVSGKVTTQALQIALRRYVHSITHAEISTHVELPRTYEWPRVVEDQLKSRLVQLFKLATGTAALKESVCATCGEELRIKDELSRVPITSFDHNLLKSHDASDSFRKAIARSRFLTSPTKPGQWSACVGSMILDSRGLCMGREGAEMTVCNECESHLRKGCQPRFAFANRNVIGDTPLPLQDLTPVEESMIARCRAKCMIVQLRETDYILPNTQRGIKGHVIVFPQNPDSLATILPPSSSEVEQYLCVVFIGSRRPDDVWVNEKAKPLAVRREKVRQALMWLKENNTLYKEVIIDQDRIGALPVQGTAPYQFEFHAVQGAKTPNTTSTYDPVHEEPGIPPSRDGEQTNNEIVFQNVVISDVDGDSSASVLKAAAIRHLRSKKTGFIEVPHGEDPINEFYNPSLFPKIAPTLFPYGIGGLEDTVRSSPIPMDAHVRHLLRLADRRFQKHFSFFFTAFNMMQRRQMLLRTKLKVDTPRFDSVAHSISNISLDAVQRVTERLARGESSLAVNADERRVMDLMKEVKSITTHVPGSAASRVAMRNEIRGLMMTCGLPSWFITVNPADVYNPLVKFLGGADIDIDALLPEQVPDFWEQSILIAKNPAIAAKFFNVYIKAFIKTVLGFGCEDNEIKQKGGIVGRVKAHYGCVEAQGRGTLHCHMLVWIQDALNPNELKSILLREPTGLFSVRLLEMLDDTISNAIPFQFSNSADPLDTADKPHPCATRGVGKSLDRKQDREKDLRDLVKECQLHSHKPTCYKYWRGDPDPKVCRFDLDEGNVNPVSSVDPETGELHLRRVNGLVNNFNLTITEAVRCNTDIKFIGSGQSAKAILYYITDYVTKTQLKAHVAFSALELATRRMGEFDPERDEPILHAKRLLQKCAYAMLSHQELSAQQVMSYLLDYEDHFTSHQYRNLYWTTFERALERMDPGARLVPPNEQTKGVTGNGQDPAGGGDMNQDDGTLDEEEVVIASELETLVPRLGAVSDYLLRGPLFHDLTVWDFFVQTRKMKGVKRYDPLPNIIHPGPMGDFNAVPGMDKISQLLNDSAKLRPSDKFQPSHLQAGGHILRVLLPSQRLVPVPIGPGIPRRGRPDTNERYCRLMLILFKPWRCLADLKSSSSTWDRSFHDFLQKCPDRYHVIMNNMQLLHECKDSRDDHFAQRRSKQRPHNEYVNTAWMETVSPEVDELNGEETTDDILSHILSIEESRSRYNMKINASVEALVAAADRAGLFADFGHPIEPASNDTGTASAVEVVRNVTTHQEAEWKTAYELVKVNRKSRLMALSGGVLDQSATEVLKEIPSMTYRALTSSDKGPNDTPAATIRWTSTIHNDEQAGAKHQSKTMVDLAHEFALNHDQARAFSLICDAATRPKQKGEPLRMYLGGSGGTGKSRVIKVVSEFFERRGEARRLRLTSYTGVAAHNIGGMTIHAALSMSGASSVQSKSGKGKTQRDLIAMWDGVDFLFVDEVSMIGCKFLYQMHQSLSQAKGNPRPFGGINIIFAGDFAQLPPVGQKKLFAKLNVGSDNQGGTVSSQENMMGQLLWLQVRDVVILHQQMRQGGPENARYAELLERLRYGGCSKPDFELLNTRLSSNIQSSTDHTWIDVPIIVSSNAAKDALNEHASVAFASSRRLHMDWYYARDFHHGKVIEDPRIKDELYTYHSGRTSQRLHRLPLVVGLPVMLSYNYDVDNGAVNGSIGRIKSIRYETEADQRFALSCVLDCPTYTGDVLPHLNTQEIAVLEDTVDISLDHPHSMKRLTLKRRQLPITPSFAFTVYKSQGLTLSRAAVDIDSCRTTEEAYTMLSRVKSLDSLMILRPFASDRISSRQSEESRQEFRRLKQLHLMTLMKYSTNADEATRLETQIGEAVVPVAIFNGTVEGANQALRDFQSASAEVWRRVDNKNATQSKRKANDIGRFGESKLGNKRRGT